MPRLTGQINRQSLAPAINKHKHTTVQHPNFPEVYGRNNWKHFEGSDDFCGVSLELLKIRPHNLSTKRTAAQLEGRTQNYQLKHLPQIPWHRFPLMLHQCNPAEGAGSRGR